MTRELLSVNHDSYLHLSPQSLISVEYDPLSLMREIGWNYEQLAIALGVSSVVARRWGFDSRAKNYAAPSNTVLRLAGILHQLYIQSQNL